MNRHRLPFARPIAVTAAIAVWFTGLACMATCLFGCHARAATPAASSPKVFARKKAPHCTRACCRKSADEDRATKLPDHARTISGTTDPDGGEFCPLAGKSNRFVNEREITVDSLAAGPVAFRPHPIRRLPAALSVRFSPIPGRGSGTHLRLCVFRI